MLTRFAPRHGRYRTPLLLFLSIVFLTGIAFLVSESVAFTNPISEEEQEEIYNSLPKPPGSGLPPPPELPEDLHSEVPNNPYSNLPPPPPMPPKPKE